ncbi:kinesin light chain [Plakobranchus ocellatus]|uniref:Kinesin light chain n=1 Tax=Plakobranchus ocellatus TaxID=259542 RepID=A0AAV3XQK7_9GAST|nr:kinesin light chain [Plakobranchus ocellatus]
MPVEIGARGFVGSSAYDLLSKLSMFGNRRTKALRLLAEQLRTVLAGYGAEGMKDGELAQKNVGWCTNKLSGSNLYKHFKVVHFSFGFQELAEAVDSRYLKDKNTKIKYQRIIVNYFKEELKDKDEYKIQLNDKTVRRPADELPWLLYELGDRNGLMDVLSDLAVFGRLFLDQEFELIQLWRWTELSGEQIADRYLAVVQTRAQEIAKRAEQKPELGEIIKLTLLSYLMALSYFMEMAHFQVAQEKILMVQLQLMANNKSKKSSSFIEHSQANVQNKLAHLYTDTGRLEQARDLHLEVLKKRERFVEEATTPEEKTTALKAVGSSYHGIAMLYSKLGHVEEAISYYEKALEFQKDSDDDAEIADTLHNIGVMQMKVGKYKEALELCTKSFHMYEKIYFVNMPPAMAVMLGNIAVCHRNLGQVKEAETMYLKSIEISERSVGRQHPHVALGLMNIATLEINRQQFQKAEVYLRESVEIFQKTETSDTNVDYIRCLEKFTFCLIKLEKHKEAITNFQTLYPRACSGIGGLKAAWPAVYAEVIDLLLSSNLIKLAHEVALGMLDAGQTGQCLEKFVVQYHKACKTLKVKSKPEFSLEKALEKSPGSLVLLRYYVEEELIPAKNVAGLLSMVDKVDAVRKIGPDLYGTAATWCDNAKAKDILLALLDHAVKKFPDETNFVCSLANELYNREDFSKALVHCRKLVQLEPNNPNHRLMHGDLTIRQEQFDEAKKVFKDMIAAFPNNEQVTTHVRN